MACYHPLYVRYADGQFSRFGGKLTKAILQDIDLGEIVPVPCGKCPGCRLDRSRRWADRMLLEYERPAGELPPRTALFVTLTYDDDHVPKVRCTDRQWRDTLSLADTQDYHKRLRKYFSPAPLRYFLAGEYGDLTFRPHYHEILFGLDLERLGDAIPWSQGEQPGSVYYLSPAIAKIWQKGNVLVSPVNYKTFAYVSRYVLKKQFDSDDGKLFYKGRKAPFVTMSRRPGIGLSYFTDDDTDVAAVSDGTTVKLLPRPRQDFLRLKDNDPYRYEILAAEKRLKAESRQRAILSQCDLSLLDKLAQDENIFLRKTKLFDKRGKV